MTVSSSDAKDTAAGVGARTLTLTGLDANYDRIGEDIVLNGQSGVNTVNSYLRLFEGNVNTVGSEADNAGVIHVGTGSISSGVPANSFLQIEAGSNSSLMAMYTVPRDYYCMLVANYITISSGKIANAHTVSRNSAVTNAAFDTIYAIRVYQADYVYQFVSPLRIEEKFDIEIRMNVDSTSQSGDAGFELICIQKDVHLKW